METIEEWLNRIGKRGWTYKFPDWPKDLFSWKYDKIIAFLKERFEQTKDPQEYYACMPYLIGHVPEDVLYVHWMDPKRTRCKDAGSEIGTSNDTLIAPIDTLLAPKMIILDKVGMKIC